MMLRDVINHLWQSTVFLLAAGLLALALRGARAQVRYWLWFSASLKFLFPFALLFLLGRQVQWTAPVPAVPAAVVQMSEPFGAAPAPLPSPGGRRDWSGTALLAVWGCGFAAVVFLRLRAWRRVRAALRASTPADLGAPVTVRITPGLLEPGVVGILRQVLLLPEGIAARLTPEQLEAVLAHEVCHMTRRDNLTASLHMVVEAVFWFYPPVWWLGARMVAERERACDEEVLRGGRPAHTYAEAILQVCRHYVESPLACVSGISGSLLPQRIRAILTGRVAGEMNWAKKAALAAAGVAAVASPVLVGMMRTPPLRAQASSASAPPPVLRKSLVPWSSVLGKRAPQAAAPVQTAVQEFEHTRRVAYAREKFGSAANPMGRTYVRYGPADEVEDRGETQLWRYHYLEAFHSGVEFAFTHGVLRINWPPPAASFPGSSAAAPDLVDALNRERRESAQPQPATEGPALHASFQVYAAAEYGTLAVPLDGFSGTVDILSQVRTSDGRVVASARDAVKAIAGTWQSQYMLEPGSYVCRVLVREKETGRTTTEMISIEVK